MRIASLEAERRFSTAANYKCTLRSIEAHFSGKVLWLDQLNRSNLNQYNKALYERGLSRNTVSFYNRILRAVCNRAAEEGYAAGSGCFAHLYTGVENTKKRALSETVMRRIIHFDPGKDANLALSRDLFLFSFYCRGMSFVDIAYLTSNNIVGEYLTYARHKTGQRLVVHIEPCIREIISRYSGTPYLFPVIHSKDPRKAYHEYINHLHRHNLLLKELGRQCGATVPLNSHAARHSWATISRNMGTSISLISSALGHTSETTTRIYLESISQADVDSINRKLQRYLFSDKRIRMK